MSINTNNTNNTNTSQSISKAFAAKIILENNILGPVLESGSGDYKGKTSENSVSPLDASPYMRNNTRLTKPKELDTPKVDNDNESNGGMNFKDKDGNTINDHFKDSGKIEETTMSPSETGLILNKIKTMIFENYLINNPEQPQVQSVMVAPVQPEILPQPELNPVPEVLQNFDNVPAGAEAEMDTSDNIDTNTIDPSILGTDTANNNQLTGPQYFAPDNNYLNPSDQEEDFEVSPYAIVNKMLNNTDINTSPEEYPDTEDSLAIKSSVQETPSCNCGCPIMENILILARK